MTEALRRRLLSTLPDRPRWVETRGSLLAGECDLYGDESGCLVRDRREPLLCIIGRVGRDLLERALAGLSGEFCLICEPEEGEALAEWLPEWSREPARLHTLSGRSAEPVGVDARIRQVKEPSADLLDHLPLPLRDEIERSAGRRPMMAAWSGERAVAFCYAAFETESFWDVSVDTLDGFRRRGLAGACAVALIRRLRARGLEPVWGAVESNAASLGLAAKLGFRVVDRLAVFEARLEGGRAIGI